MKYINIKSFKKVLFLGYALGIFSQQYAHAELSPAINYQGKIFNQNGATKQTCELLVAISKDSTDQVEKFALSYLMPIHGEEVTPGFAGFNYFDAQTSLGSNFYSVDQAQNESILTLSLIELRPESSKFGTLVNPNDIPELNKNKDIQTSMVLSFKKGLSYEDFTQAFINIFNSNKPSAADLAAVDQAELMTILYWHAGHYDRIRCGALKFHSYGMLDLELNPIATTEDPDDHDHEDDDHSHDTEIDHDEEGQDHSLHEH